MPKRMRQIIDILRSSGFLWSASLVLDRAGVRVLNKWDDVIATTEILENQVRAILRAWGIADDHIETAMGNLIYADLMA